MDIEWGGDAARKFVTNVGLITSSGPHGDNVMSAEWTHHVSYSPGLIMVNVGFNSATNKNIKESKEFGVSICAQDQKVASSVAGNYSGKNTDKIKFLESLGFGFYRAKKINAPMVKGASMNAECRLVREEKLGDHTMFVGEVVNLETSGKEPLILHNGAYWKVTPLEKTPQTEREKIRNLAEKFAK